MRTRLLLITGSVIFTMVPLYQTAWHDAIYDGAVLLIAIAFLVNGLFRCIDPQNLKGNRTVFFIVSIQLLLTAALLQYGPIATDLRREKEARIMSLQTNSILPLAEFEKERAVDQTKLPNSSIALLLASILTEFSVTLLLED
jgi:hypothetical protein